MLSAERLFEMAKELAAKLLGISDGVFYIENFPKNFFQNTVDKSPPLLYNGIVGRGQEPRGRRKNYDRLGTIYGRM